MHEETLTTITCGLQRIVCESCGHVGVRYIRPLAGPIDRRRFARQADLIHEATMATEEPDGELHADLHAELAEDLHEELQRELQRELHHELSEEFGGFSYSAVGVFSSKELVPIRNRA